METLYHHLISLFSSHVDSKDHFKTQTFSTQLFVSVVNSHGSLFLGSGYPFWSRNWVDYLLFSSISSSSHFILSPTRPPAVACLIALPPFTGNFIYPWGENKISYFLCNLSVSTPHFLPHLHSCHQTSIPRNSFFLNSFLLPLWKNQKNSLLANPQQPKLPYP